MAWTQDDLDALSAAITGGIKAVTYSDGRKVEYQSTGEMLALRRTMKAELAALSTHARRQVRVTRAVMRRP